MKTYLMEDLDETLRLEMKTDPEVVRRQARWCGLKPGMRVLDVGCGPGRTSSILFTMLQPAGELVGIDFSEQRIEYAKKHYGVKPDLKFTVYDVTEPLEGFGAFDLIWVRFFLEYYRKESAEIVGNLSKALRPGGTLCLMDLDRNCLNHYELPRRMEEMLHELIVVLEEIYDFDPYAGRKLFSYLFDLGYKDIQMDLMPHHLIYGELKGTDSFNWGKKVALAFKKAPELFSKYPGEKDGFLEDFKRFFHDPRRFTYTPLILCKGTKPLPPETL